jgi:gluconolactonase
MSAAALACLSGALLTACAAGEGDDPESESNAAFGPRNNTPGAAGNGSAPVGNAPSVGAPGAAGSPSTTPAPTGNNNGETPNGNVSNVAPPQQMMGGSNQNGMQNNGAAGSGGVQNGGAAGGGQMPPNPPPPAVEGVGRVGVEQCPAGPFGEPVPANPVVTKLFSVGVDNFFNFEGPVWVGDALYFSEIGGGQAPPPANINRYRPGGMLERGVIPNTGSNGLAIDAQGNLIAATHDVGAISTFTLAGVRGQLGAQNFNNTRFNSPNDLVQRADGNVYFTDPTFQAPGNPQGATRVYRIPPQGAATVVDDTLSNPNGITLSPDGNTLYVTSASGFRRYELAEDGTPGPAITINLADGLQTPDGMGMDCAGNVYTVEHFRRLIRVFDPQGNQIGSFGGPAVFDRDVTNVAFGGADRRTMFVTTLTQGQQGGLFQVQLNIPGFAY